MKQLLLAALAAVSIAAHADGLVDLGAPVPVQPVAGQVPVESLTASLAAGHAEELRLRARTPIDSRLLTLPAGAAGELHRALQKARRWVQVAADNQADISKPLACIGADPTGACTQAGVAIQAGQLGLLFVATGGGRNTALLVTYRTGAGDLERTAFYLDPAALDALAERLAPWQQQLAQARAQAGKAALFQ